MKNKRKQSGVILLLAIAMIPLVGIGILVVTRHSRYLIEETHYQHLQAEARNMVLSARAWADHHQIEILNKPQGQIQEIDVTGLDISRGVCRIEIISQTESGCTIEITAVSKSGTKSWTEKCTFTLPR